MIDGTWKDLREIFSFKEIVFDHFKQWHGIWIQYLADYINHEHVEFK